MPSDARTPETHVLFMAESALVYCFDFSNEPAVTAGATISSPVVAADVAKVTLSGPTVLSADFVQLDEDGLTVGTVPSGKGVKVLVTPAAKGQCTVTCTVTASDGQVPGQQVIFVVK